MARIRRAWNARRRYFPTYRLFIIGVTAVVLLWLFLERTNYGLIIRAGARDPQIVRILGIDVGRVWLMVFGIGTGLAALAGPLAAPLQGASPEMGNSVLAIAFVVTVVGGMGSLLEAVLAGLLVGAVVSMVSLFAPETVQMAIFALMAVDEPSEGVMPILADEMMALFTAMRDQGTTILLVEQNVKLALDIADRVYIMDGGRIVYRDRPCRYWPTKNRKSVTARCDRDGKWPVTLLYSATGQRNSSRSAE